MKLNIKNKALGISYLKDLNNFLETYYLIGQWRVYDKTTLYPKRDLEFDRINSIYIELNNK